MTPNGTLFGLPVYLTDVNVRTVQGEDGRDIEVRFTVEYVNLNQFGPNGPTMLRSPRTPPVDWKHEGF